MHDKYSKLKTLWDPFAAEVKRLAMESSDYIDDCLADELVYDLEERVKTIVEPRDAQFSIYDIISKLAIRESNFDVYNNNAYTVYVNFMAIIHTTEGYVVFDEEVGDEVLLRATHPQEVINFIFKEEE